MACDYVDLQVHDLPVLLIDLVLLKRLFESSKSIKQEHCRHKQKCLCQENQCDVHICQPRRQTPRSVINQHKVPEDCKSPNNDDIYADADPFKPPKSYLLFLELLLRWLCNHHLWKLHRDDPLL